MNYLEILSNICRVVMFATTFYLFYLGFSKTQNHLQLKPFGFLSIFSLADTINYIVSVIILDKIDSFLTTSKWWQLFYIFIELIIIANFLLDVNKIKKRLQIIRFLILISFLIIIISIMNEIDFKKTFYTYFTVFEIVFINYYAIRFFLSNKNDSASIVNQKASIITKGLFFFINIASPYYIIIQIISDQPNSIISSLSFISDIGYIVFFSAIIKAYKWKTTK
jgi:hypothetical protein